MTLLGGMTPAPKQVICLGVDHGTLKAGLAVWGPRGLVYHRQLPLGPGGAANLGRRLRLLRCTVQAVAATYRVSVIALEKPITYTGARDDGTHAQGRGSGVVGAAWGMLHELAFSLGLPCLDIYPATAKNALTSNARASKEQMQAAASMLCGGVSMGEDEADAVGISMAGAAVYWESQLRAAVTGRGGGRTGR